MAQIMVTVRSDKGDLGSHLKYGALTPGRKLPIEEEDFSEGLFERPSPEWRSPHELKDKTRSEELKQSVGVHVYEPPKQKKPAPADTKEG